ncbi:MAG: O-antigen ligase family protein [Defluviitaleaceae bacterium]|nr:O-antigen ligase family protein [Defluviitaleaceae bacterium]
MQTDSVIIKKIAAFLAWLNFYFEHSLIFRGFLVVKKFAGESKILRAFISTRNRDYWQGSIILRIIMFGARKKIFFIAKIFNFFSRLNENSLNKKIFLFFFPPQSEFSRRSLSGQDGSPKLGAHPVRNFFSHTISTCFPAKILRWFFCENVTNPTAQTLANENEQKIFAHAISAQKFLKIAYMVFISGALTIPAPLWNNKILLLSAVFFAAIFSAEWFFRIGKNFSAEKISEKISFEKISPALVFFVFFCALSIVTGYGGGDSLRVFIIFFACVVHSVLITIFFDEKDDFRLFFLILACALAAVSVFGFYQFAAGIEIREELVDLGTSPGLSRLYSTMGNPNNDAMFWAMVLPFLIAVCVTAKCDKKRLVLAILILIVLAAFAMTYSRAGYVAFMAGVAIFVLMTAPRLVPVAMLVLILAVPFIPAGIIERLFTLGQDTSSKYRFLIWEGVGRMLEDFWVSGIGMGPAAFIRIYRGYAHPLAERAMHSHNTFLDILSHSGIGAFLAFIAYLFRLYRRGISAFFSCAEKEFKIFIAAGISAVTVFIVFGVGEYVWFYPRVMLVFWVVAGLVSAMAERAKNA